MDKGCRLDPTSQLNFHALIDQGEIKTWDVLMSIFRCACCCGPRERWSVVAWLWHPDNDELCCSLLCQCMLLVLSQISVHYAFINDPVVLVSTGFEMEHFKHGEYWVIIPPLATQGPAGPPKCKLQLLISDPPPHDHHPTTWKGGGGLDFRNIRFERPSPLWSWITCCALFSEEGGGRVFGNIKFAGM